MPLPLQAQWAEMQLRKALKMVRMAPRIALYKIRGGSARDYGKQWDRFWSDVKGTGDGGNVLWDTEDLREMEQSFDAFAPHMDLSLPFLDLGCGNGRRASFLASKGARVLGIDVSETAIKRARSEWAHVAEVEFRVADAVSTAVAREIHDELGDMNIYMRGVFHVIQPADRASFSETLSILLGDAGTLYQIETDGAFLDYMLDRPDKTPTGLPALVHHLVSHGIVPVGFGKKDEQRWFPPAKWELIDSGSTVIQTLPLADGEVGNVPAYYLLARPR